jgi:hypothetical protein
MGREEEGLENKISTTYRVYSKQSLVIAVRVYASRANNRTINNCRKESTET